MIKILFVCHGNICRSPMAEFVMKSLVSAAGLERDFYIASAATSSEELGNPVYPQARRKLAKHGISCAGKTARRMSAADYAEFDLLIGIADGRIETEFQVRPECGLQDIRQYMERFRPAEVQPRKQHRELFHPVTKLVFWLALMVVISTANNRLVYAVYAALILLTVVDGWFGTAITGGACFAALWAANALFPNTVFSFMLVLFPRIIAIGISMRTLIGRNEASRTLTALREMHLPERLIMIVAVIFRFFPVLSGDMKLLRQSIRTRGAFTTPWQKLSALPSYIEILTVPMALRVIRIAETLSASAETRGIDLKRRKSNYMSLRFSVPDAVFCAMLAAAVAAGLIS